MMTLLLSGLLTLLVTECLDAIAPPRGARAASAWPVRATLTLTLFGAVSTLTGNAWAAFGVTIGLAAVVVAGSAIKCRLLDEPIVFSDLMVIVSFLRAPRFYLHALPLAARVGIAIGVPVAALLLALALLHGHTEIRVAGAAMLIMSALTLRSLLRRMTIMEQPNLRHDVHYYGVFATLLIYHARWRAQAPSPAAQDLAGASPLPELVIIQCESFADPVALFSDGRALPALEAARANAWQSGRLLPSGFGAYTMRSEFGVLCGREEDDLGFRRFDPFLSAAAECHHALPNRLAADYSNRIFVHPHDLRFYARDRILPLWGFTQVLGAQAFAAAPRKGPYVADEAFGETVSRLLRTSAAPALLYGVTMENHGPWAAGRIGAPDARAAYEIHLHNSDRMLAAFMAQFEARGADAVFVFFGDHRPSLPGDLAPEKGRDTVYVIIRYVGGKAVACDRKADLSPAGLNAAVLGALGLQPAGEDAEKRAS